MFRMSSKPAHIAFVFLAGALTLAPSALMAQAVTGDTRSRGEAACASDARRYCKKVLGQDDFTVLRCLQENRTKLRSACHKFLADNGQL